MPTDARQRQQALEPSRSFIVQAPAGSGKTEVLTQRFLKLLATVERPERVLAITFTRKATQEMRSRIMARLSQAAAREEPEAEHDRQAVALAAAVLKRDRELGWNLLGSPGRLRITTIDGLCVQLLARDPVDGPRWAGCTVLEDSRPLHRQAVRNLFSDIDEMASGHDGEAGEASAAQDALVELLVHLGGDAHRLESLLMEMLKRRSLWKRHLLATDEQLAELLTERQELVLRSFRSALGEASLVEAMDCSGRLGFNPGVEGEGLEAELSRAVAFARLLSTGALKPRAPGGINKRVFPDMEEAERPALARLKEIYQAWHETPEAMEEVERMASWPPIDIPLGGGTLSSTLLDSARKVLSLALFELNALMSESAQADFTAVTDAALESLGEDTQPADTLLAEDSRIEHLLMDEFQDTSHTQFQLLQRLISGWQAGDGRSLFLVGDPMQSIYRFREANVGFFNQVVSRGRLGQVPVEAISLSSNFRSSAELIDWFNATFKGVFPTQDESDSGAVSYTPVSAELDPGGTVELHALNEKLPGESHDDRVVRLVSSALEDESNESIAILVRGRPQVRDLAAALIANGIEFAAVNLEALTGREVVQDLQILTRALVHPMDRVAWIALLRAPWCGLRLAEIHQVVGEEPAIEVFQAIEQAVQNRVLDESSLGRLNRLLEVMRHVRRCAGRQPLSRCVESSWILLGGPLCCDAPTDIENAEVFFELLEEIEQAGREEIVERLEELLEERNAASSPARVQIMTIHNAKGLEFDVVILPDLQRGTPSTDSPLVAMQEFTDREQRSGVLMAPLTTSNMADASIYRYLNRVDAQRGRYESQRVLYVACTRARRALHLLARVEVTSKNQPSVREGTFLSFLEKAFGQQFELLLERWAEASAETEVDGPSETIDAAELEIPPLFPLKRLARTLPGLDLPEVESRNQMGLREWPNREAVALGTVLHEWLELVHDHPAPRWDDARIDRSAASIRSSLVRAGASGASLDKLQAQSVRVLKKALADQTLMRILDGRERTGSWSELEMYWREGCSFSRHVIDLLIRNDQGKLQILDYKSGDEPRPYSWQEQLERYSRLLETLVQEKNIETEIYRLTAD